jgi:hypothetical protein
LGMKDFCILAGWHSVLSDCTYMYELWDIRRGASRGGGGEGDLYDIEGQDVRGWKAALFFCPRAMR